MSITALTQRSGTSIAAGFGMPSYVETYGKVIAIRATGLKPETKHIFKANGKDVTSSCKQKYPTAKKLGENLVSGKDGVLELYYFPNLTGFAESAYYNIAAYGDPFDGVTTLNAPFERLFPWVTFSSSIKFELEDATTRSSATTQSTSVPVANPVISAPPPPAPVAPQNAASSTVTKKPVGDPTEKVEVLSTSVTSTTKPVNETTTTYNGGTPLSAISCFFDYIQTFYVDSSAVNNVSKINLTNIVLYFERKPSKTVNKSGIRGPGVYVSICEVNNGIPDLTKVYLESKVRVDWDNVSASLDASAATVFQFNSPLSLKTNQYYGIIVNYEDPDYSLWTATQGETLVDGGLCPGTYNNGQLFRASNYLEVGSTTSMTDYFKPISQTDLKFEVNVAKYSQTSATVEMVNDDYEFLTVADVAAGPIGLFIVGEKVYQDFGNNSANVTFYRSGTLAVDQNLTRITGTGTSFINDIEVDDYIIITDGTIGNSDIRKVLNVIDNSTLVVDETPTFSNTAAKYKMTAVGTIDFIIPSTNTFILKESNANERTRFIKDGVSFITISAGGSGFTNTDYIVFTGGAANGVANITTNSAGGITAINIVNTGYGFTTTPSIEYKQQDGSVRTPSVSPTLAVTVGSQLKSEITLATARIANVTDYTVDHFIPDLQVDVKGGTITSPQYNFAFKSNNQYIINNANYQTLNVNQDTEVQTYSAKIASKSLEVLNTATLYDSEGKSGVAKLTINTNNPFESPEIHNDKMNMYMFYNEINNDTTNEHLRTGNAVSKHISTKISFAKDRFAEDIRVISTCYRPRGSDVKIYARVHNSNDEEAFDDKNWTELELKEGNDFYSSSSDRNDYVELTYGFPAYPPTANTLDGFVTINTGNTQVVGVGTTFTTAIANGDVIRLYDPVFSNTSYSVAIANTVESDTVFHLNSIIANVSLAAATLKVDKVKTPYTAFNNIQNDNIVRYYNTSLMELDTYNTFAIKIVLLSDSTNIIPRVQDVRAIGVSI